MYTIKIVTLALLYYREQCGREVNMIDLHIYGIFTDNFFFTFSTAMFSSATYGFLQVGE